MSTLNVNAIDKESGSTLTLGGSGTTVNVSNMVPDVALSNRNLVINGAMNVAQRGTQVTGVTTGDHRTVDRSFFNIGNLGTWTIDQSTDAPNGFSNSHKITCTTADASPAASDYVLHNYFVEAKDLQHLAYGTADAKTMTISFWVKSNKTGTASYSILQMDNSLKMFSAGYTINSANTWEYKTILIPADTAGIINNDNGTGLNMAWWLNTGSDWTGGSFTGSWVAEDSTRKNASNLGVGGAVNDYFAITGIQMEVGSVATPFEHESYGNTLAKCQRYYQKSYNIDVVPQTNNAAGRHYFYLSPNTTSGNKGATVSFPVTMRASPSVTIYRESDGAAGVFSNGATANVITIGQRSFMAYANSTGQDFFAHWVADSEL